MARHELLEAIFEAQFALESAEPGDLPASLERLNLLLDQALTGKTLTRRELLSGWAMPLSEATRLPWINSSPLRSPVKTSSKYSG